MTHGGPGADRCLTARRPDTNHLPHLQERREVLILRQLLLLALVFGRLIGRQLLQVSLEELSAVLALGYIRACLLWLLRLTGGKRY